MFCIEISSAFGISIGLYRRRRQVASFESGPAIVFNIVTQSSTVRVNIAGTSIEFTNGIKPCRDTKPYVGFNPINPQYEAGFLTEPPVSEPRALKITNVAVIFLFFLLEINLFSSCYLRKT